MNTCNEPEVIRDISSLKNAEQLKQWQLKSAAILEADLRRRTTDQPEAREHFDNKIFIWCALVCIACWIGIALLFKALVSP